MKRVTAAAMAAATTTLMLIGCGSPGDDRQGEGGLTEVRIATQPIVDSAPLYLGRHKGFFRKQGIDLTIDSAVGGAAVVPGVVSGNLDFGRGNLLSTMIANDKGLNLECVTNANSAAGNPDISAVMVPKDSPIKSPADLAGRKVSVNTFNNIGDTTIRSVVEKAGGDPKQVTFVEIPFPEAPAALQKGQVDAAWILEPFVTQAKQQGARVISYNFVEFHPELDISCVFASQQMMQSDPDLVKRFQAAMNASLEYSQEHEREVREIVGTYTDIEPAVLKKIVLPTFRTEFNTEATAKLGREAHRYGTLSKEPDLDALLPEER